jgi:lysyl-tRNA synthetase class 2
MMKQNVINSTALASVDYDASRELLRIEFRDRTTYIYLGVPADVHDGLVCAPSQGTYFNRVIRGRYCSLPAPIADESAAFLS